MYFGLTQTAVASKSLASGGALNENSVIKQLRRSLYPAGESALIEYNGVCNRSMNPNPISFPPTEVQLPTRGATGVAAIREMFRKDRKVTVAEGADGLIRIKIGDVLDLILKTKISLLVLDKIDQYTPVFVINAMLNTKGMQAAMHRLNARGPKLFESIMPSLSLLKGNPHLPALMQNVSVGQSLASIAKTFEGIVVYSSCKQSDGTHLFYMEFFGIKGFVDP